MVNPGFAADLSLPTPRRPKKVPDNPIPAPETPEIPPVPDLTKLTPQRPSRRILSQDDLDRFTSSPTYSLVLSFIFHISEACTNQAIPRDISNRSSLIESLQNVLASIDKLVDENPPLDQGPSRFGNPAFRDFIDILVSSSGSIHQQLGLPDEKWKDEISIYLENAFGSRSRIDYGSGHELNFMMWLLCLNRLCLIQQSDLADVGLIIVPRYIRLLRKIQSLYYLEPAGSHGVWGLDDYHFLPFLFGASQLLNHPYIRPLAIHNDLMLEEEGEKYMYLDMVRYTMETKTVKGLKWTQPMLDDISGAKNWGKVENGMRRMFVKEVLGKLPVMQHFLFGSLVPAADGMSKEADIDAAMSAEATNENAHGHVHNPDTWGDCCGIKIPSIIAATHEARKHGMDGGLRRVPFD